MLEVMKEQHRCPSLPEKVSGGEENLGNGAEQGGLAGRLAGGSLWKQPPAGDHNGRATRV